MPVDISSPPVVTVDKARKDIYNQYKIEHTMVMAMIASLPAADLGEWGEVVKVAILLLGPDSAIYRVFLDTIKLPFKKFAQFIATFFLVCWTNQNISKLWSDDDFNTKRCMPPVLFNRILRKMHHHGMNASFAPRFWEPLQEAFNKTMIVNFTPREAMKMLFTLDDDKNYHGYGRARNIKFGCESGLKRVRHVKDNKTGYNNHIIC